MALPGSRCPTPSAPPPARPAPPPIPFYHPDLGEAELRAVQAILRGRRLAGTDRLRFQRGEVSRYSWQDLDWLCCIFCGLERLWPSWTMA